MEIVGQSMKNDVITGITNRSLPKLNNTLTFSPALIATRLDIDKVVDLVVDSLIVVVGQ